jgi:hypothetical protein
MISPYFTFDSKGNISEMEFPINLSETERKTLLSYLWKIQTNRKFILQSYNQTKDNITELATKIEIELKR